MEVMDQRRNEIVEFVNENQTVTFTQLKEKFPSVSEMTLRTDLKYLDQVKRIVRFHGGAKSMDVVSGNDVVLKLRYGRNANEKKEIAQKSWPFCPGGGVGQLAAFLGILNWMDSPWVSRGVQVREKDPGCVANLGVKFNVG